MLQADKQIKESEIRKLFDEDSQLGLRKMASYAWVVRENAYILGKSKVGCVVLSAEGKIYEGCNVEHRFRCHDIHAEVNAISSMIASGSTEIRAVVIAADRDRFTPC